MKTTGSADVKQEWFSPPEAGRYLGVTRETIYRWTREGRIHRYELPTGGGSRYRRADLDAFVVGDRAQ